MGKTKQPYKKVNTYMDNPNYKRLKEAFLKANVSGNQSQISSIQRQGKSLANNYFKNNVGNNQVLVGNRLYDGDYASKHTKELKDYLSENGGLAYKKDTKGNLYNYNTNASMGNYSDKLINLPDKNYKGLAEDHVNSIYNARVRALKNALNSNRTSLENQKSGINQNYDSQVENQNRLYQKGVNSFSNQMTARGLGRSSVVSSGIGGMTNTNSRLVSNLNDSRASALNGVDNQISTLEQNFNNTVDQMDIDKIAQINDYIEHLKDKDYDRALTEYNLKYRVNRDREQDDRYYEDRDYSRSRDKVSDDKYNKEWDYKVGRDKVSDDRYSQNFQHQLDREKIDDDRYKQNWDRQGTWHNQDNAFRDKKFNADEAYKSKQLALSKARASRSSGSGSSGYSKTSIKNQTYLKFDDLLNTDHSMAKNFLDKNKVEIVNNIGYSGYSSLVKKYDTAVKNWNEKHSYSKKWKYGTSR